MRHTRWVWFIFFAASLTGWSQSRPLGFDDMFYMNRISDPQISPDGSWVAYVVTRYSPADDSRNSDIYLISTDGRQRKQLTTHPKADVHPRWAPDGQQLGFISARNGQAQVYVIDMAGGEARVACAVPTGVESFEWSPTGRYLAVETVMYPEAQTPAQSVEMAPIRGGKATATGRLIDGLLFRHWNAWREGKKNRVVVMPKDGTEEISVTPAAADCPPISLGSKHDYVWSPDGTQLCFVQNTDPVVAISTNNDLWLVQRDGSELKPITTHPGNDNGPRFSPDGKYIAYLSMPRAGFEADQQNLMVYELASGQVRNLTAGLDRFVTDFAWSPGGERLYFYVPHHGRHRLYEVPLAGGAPKLLLQGHYISAMQVSPNERFLVLQLQASHQPDELYRLDLHSRKLTQLTFANRQVLRQIDLKPLEEYWFTGANGDSVHLLMVKPPQFDPAQKYPLICLIHGGPQGAWSDNFHYRWNSQMFAAPGYVVIMINFHGSRGYGQAFCDAVSKDWGGAPFEDIVTGTRWAIEQFGFIDGQRVGAAGASYGGFMINWIAGHNEDDLFKVLISHAGVFEQVSMFGATEELWFPIWEFNGKPWEEGSLYQKWNPANHVANFHTPTLVIHGEHDYRVPYTQGLQMFTALQLKGVPSRLLFFPDEDHFVRKPANARLWWETVYDWLARYLTGQAE